MKRVTVALSITIALAAIFLGISPLKNLNLAYAQTVDDPDAIRVIRWNHAGTQLGVGYSNGAVEVRNTTSLQILHSLQCGAEKVTAVNWKPDDAELAASNADGDICVWDAATGILKASLIDPELTFALPVSWVGWNIQATEIWAINTSLGSEGRRVWNANTYSFTEGRLGAALSNIIWINSNSKVIVDNGGSIEIRNALTFDRVISIDEPVVNPVTGERGLVESFDWNPIEGNILIGSSNGWVRTWDGVSDTHTLNLRATDSNEYTEETSYVRAVRFSDDGTTIQAVAADGTFRTWDAVTGDLLNEQQLPAPIYAAEWSPDGSRLAYGGGGTITTPQIGSNLGGFVWEDTDRNGLREAGEPSLAGITVRLLDGTTEIEQMASGPDGAYSFLVDPGIYTVVIDVPAAYAISPLGGDSMIDPATGQTAPITVTLATPPAPQDAGLNLRPR